jgi:type IV secretory pathway VirB6-like protein
VSVSVVKCNWMKCGEVLHCSDGLSNKVPNSITRHIDNMKWLLIYSLGSIFYQCIYIVVFLFNTVIYVFLLLSLCILIVCLCIFIVPAGTLRLP